MIAVLHRLAGLTHLAAVVAAAAHIALFLVLAALRIPYPYELEWMEGASVDHVRWLLAGNCLYGPPALEFVPYIYTPLYFWVSAPVAAILGTDFLALRLVSLAASVGSLALLGWIAGRASESRAIGVLAAGLFAATFRAGGAWYDVARVDALLVFLLLAAVAALYNGRGWRADALGGVLLFMAFLAKQVALVVAAPLVLFVLIARPGWQRLVMPAVLGGLLAIATVALQAASDGWFAYYVFDLPRQHVLADHYYWRGFWQEDVIEVVPILLLMAVLLPEFTHRRNRRNAKLWALLLVAAIGSAWLGRLHSGGWDNVLIPMHALLALLGALGYAAVRRTLRDRWAPASLALSVALILQFGLLWYPPAAQVPTQADRAAGDALIARIARVDGDVFIPYHGHYATMAGKPAWVQGAALSDVIRGTDAELSEHCNDLLREALAAGRFGALILDESLPALDQVANDYVYIGPAVMDPDAFWPVTGRRIRPERIYLLDRSD